MSERPQTFRAMAEARTAARRERRRNEKRHHFTDFELAAHDARIREDALRPVRALQDVIADELALHGWYEATNSCVCGERPADMDHHIADEIASTIAAVIDTPAQADGE